MWGESDARGRFVVRGHLAAVDWVTERVQEPIYVRLTVADRVCACVLCVIV